MGAATWFFRNWYWFNGAIAVVSVIVLCVRWGDLDAIQRIMLGQFILINLHFVEEFRLPGGFPLIANTVETTSEKPSHWPLNQWTACVGNNWFALVVYLPACIWHETTWLTLAVTLFGFLEVLMHLGIFTVLLKSWFNPGLLTSLFGFLPLGILGFVELRSAGGSIVWWEWVLAAAWPVANYVVVFRWILTDLLASKDTRFPFTDAEMERGERWTAHLISKES
jgi:hypothetical protein